MEPTFIITDADSCEESAAEHMAWLGYDDARRTPKGPDGGIDVRASRASAQVKNYGAAANVTIEHVHAFVKVGSGELFFYSRSGYAKGVAPRADADSVACFQYSSEGKWVPSNESASRAYSGRKQSTSSGFVGSDLVRMEKRIEEEAVAQREAELLASGPKYPSKEERSRQREADREAAAARRRAARKHRKQLQIAQNETSEQAEKSDRARKSAEANPIPAEAGPALELLRAKIANRTVAIATVVAGIASVLVFVLWKTFT